MTILGGVMIGDGAVIGAGSVVTRDIPANTIAVGNPCRPLRPITEDDRALSELGDYWRNAPTFHVEHRPSDRRNRMPIFAGEKELE